MTMKCSHSESKNQNIRVVIPGFTEGDPRGMFFLMAGPCVVESEEIVMGTADRKSTRLNSSHRLDSRMPSSA